MDVNDRSRLIHTFVREFDTGLHKDDNQTGDDSLPLDIVDFVTQYETDVYHHYEKTVFLGKSKESIERELILESERCVHKCLHLYGNTVPSPPQSHPVTDLVITEQTTITQPEDERIISLAWTRPDFAIVSVYCLPSEEDLVTPNVFNRTPQATGQESVALETSPLETVSLPLNDAKLRGKNEDTVDRNNHNSKGRGSRYDTPKESCSGTHCTQRRKRKCAESQMEKGQTVSSKVKQGLRGKVLNRSTEKDCGDGTNNPPSNLPNFDRINSESP